MSHTQSLSGTLTTDVVCSTSYADTVAIDCGNGSPLIQSSTGTCSYDVRSNASLAGGDPQAFTPRCLIDGEEETPPACTETVQVSQVFDLTLKKYVENRDQDAQDQTSAVHTAPEVPFHYIFEGKNVGPAPTRNTTTIADTMPEGVYLLGAPSGDGWTCSISGEKPVTPGTCVPSDADSDTCEPQDDATLATKFSCSYTGIIQPESSFPLLSAPVFSEIHEGYLFNTGSISNPDEFPESNVENDPKNQDPAVIYPIPFDLRIKKYVLRSAQSLQ